MRLRKKRNYLGETLTKEQNRRIMALEVHIQDLEDRLTERLGYMQRLIHELKPEDPKEPETDYLP